MQDVTRHSDEDIGTAARHVHAGCRKALLGCAEIRSVRDEAEGSRLVLEAGFDPRSLRLTGNVPGKGPYTGTLVHRGWRALSLRLPKSTSGGDPNVLAQAEVEV
jgi:hypothetical protein